MLGALSKLGADATIAEMIGATTGLEILAAVAGIGAAAYTGAVIGSLMVAASDSMVCTNSAQVSSSVTRWAGRNGVHIPAAVLTFLQRNPEVIMDSPSRKGYASRHRIAASRMQAALA